MLLKIYNYKKKLNLFKFNINNKLLSTVNSTLLTDYLSTDLYL